MPPTTKRKLTPDVRAARRALKAKGYTYEQAATALGRSPQHIAMVLTCHGRKSAELLQRIHDLPDNPNPTN